MKINLITVGKRPPEWIQQGYTEYAKRLSHHCTMNLVEIPAAKRAQGADIAQLRQREGEQMLQAIPQGNWVVTLTEHGQLWDTMQLARQLQTWRDKGYGLSLLIGGPDGLSAECVARAQQQWSLSLLTFPHLLVRILVVEQLYRAFSILHQHPYHRA